MKRRFSSQNLIVALGALVVLGNYERAFGQFSFPCTALEPTRQCAGSEGSGNCAGSCTPVDCEAFQTGSTCTCSGLGFIPAATACTNSGTRICGCTVDCTRLNANAQCTEDGSATSCPLWSDQCFVNCELSNQICTSVQGFEIINRNTRCFITLGGTCTDPPTTTTTTTPAPTTTTTTAPTTTVAPTTTATVTTTAAPTTTTTSYPTYANPGPSYPQPVPSVTNQRPYLLPAMMPYNRPYQPYPPFFNPYPPFVVQQSPLYEPERYGYRPNRHQNYPVTQPGPHSRHPQKVYRG